MKFLRHGEVTGRGRATRTRWPFAAVALALLVLGLPSLAAGAEAPVLVVGSKNFSESRLLAELFAQLLEGDGDFAVERRLDLAGTAVCFRALQSGAIDLYPEYTGTGLVTLLGEEARGTPAEVLRRVRRAFRGRWDLEWLAPLGFENSYEVAVRRPVAESLQLRTLADLAARGADLRYAFGYEFQQRRDGLIGLREVYGLQPRRLVGMQQNLKYQAAGDGSVDVIDVYTTDGLVLVHDLVVLDDPLGVFPPYQAAPLVRGATLRAHPAVAARLDRLSQVVDEATMRALNRRVEVEGEAIETVAADALRRWGLLDREPDAARNGRSAGRGRDLWTVLREDRQSLAHRTLEHLALVGVALALAVLLAVPLGLWLSERARWGENLIRAVGILQTIPSIALLAFLLPLLGVGTRPAIAALFLYALYPIVRNTTTGVRDADPAAAASARALGMSRRQVLLHVRLPLASGIILAGIRTAAVICVGTATLAAFIGAGGLGVPIVAGLQLNDPVILLSGALPAALLALAVDALLALVERAVRAKV